MRLFQRACLRKHLNQLYLQLISLRRGITVPISIKHDRDTERVYRDELKENELIHDFPSIPIAVASSEVPRNNNSQGHAASNPYISGINVIVQNPLLSLLFREFLESTHCWENFAFYLEVSDFIAYYERIGYTSTRLNIDCNALGALYSE